MWDLGHLRWVSYLHRVVVAGAAAILLAGASVLLGAAPAHAGDVFVEVIPNPAQAGERVEVRASCGDGNNRQAAVESDAFGRVTVQRDDGLLKNKVTIPGSKKPGDYAVVLKCQNNNTATTTLTVVNMSEPTRGPAAGAGGMAGGEGGALILAVGAATILVGVGLGVMSFRRRRADFGA